MLMQSMRTERPRGFRISGELDMSNEAVFSSMLAPEVELGGDITLDVSEVRFMDSMGVRVLLRAARELDGRGRLVVTGAREGLLRTFDIMGAQRTPGLVIVDPAAAAIEGWSGPGTALDLAGHPHSVAQARCACGCLYLYAVDDLALFWEAGSNVGNRCSDLRCECHVSPLRG